MMTVILYGIPNCDTVKKARRWLDEHGIEYTFSDFKKTAPSLTQIEQWAEAVSLDNLLNKRGTTWRKLDEQTQQQANHDKAAAFVLMAAQPSLIKRPVLEYGTQIAVGFKPELYQDIFQK